MQLNVINDEGCYFSCRCLMSISRRYSSHATTFHCSSCCCCCCSTSNMNALEDVHLNHASPQKRQKTNETRLPEGTRRDTTIKADDCIFRLLHKCIQMLLLMITLRVGTAATSTEVFVDINSSLPLILSLASHSAALCCSNGSTKTVHAPAAHTQPQRPQTNATRNLSK